MSNNAIQLKGFKELEQRLKKMATKDAKSAVRKGVREAQKVAQKEAKANATSMVGGEMGSKIAKALKVQALWKQKKGSYSLQVAVDPKKADEFVHVTKKGERQYIPNAIEHGHRKPHGKSKDVAPIPFMRTAAESTVQARLKKLIEAIRQQLDKK